MKRRNNKKLINLIKIVLTNGIIAPYMKKYCLTYSGVANELKKLTATDLFYMTTSGMPNGHLTAKGCKFLEKVDPIYYSAYIKSQFTSISFNQALANNRNYRRLKKEYNIK